MLARNIIMKITSLFSPVSLMEINSILSKPSFTT